MPCRLPHRAVDKVVSPYYLANAKSGWITLVAQLRILPLPATDPPAPFSQMFQRIAVFYRRSDIGWSSVFSSVVIVLSLQMTSCNHSTEPYIQQAPVQLDTVGFPLDIGNKWYYRHGKRSQPWSIIVKTIVDTGLGGIRFVQTSRLGQDSILGTEVWEVIGGSFFVGPLCLYNSSLTHDSSYSYSGYGEYDLSIHLDRVALFGVDTRCQIRSTYNLYTFGWGWTDKRVALGIGLYYDHTNGFYAEDGWDETYQLTGLMKQGVLFGDSL